MELKYRKLLLSELRLVACLNGDCPLSDENLIKAMTVNENIRSYGYTLTPKDVIFLAKSPSLELFYKDFSECIDNVDAKPMYPNYPKTIMKISEAQFRFDQMVHYFSTYGMEFLFGEGAALNWLPKTPSTKKTVDDKTLLEAKVLQIIDEADAYTLPFSKILSKRERMTDKEKLIISEAVKHLDTKALSDIEIPFKENLLPIFDCIFNSEVKNKAELLHKICKHTGDVFKCADYSLTRSGYHFRTSQKRLLVKLLESYPSEDFKTNVILSNKKAERVKLLLNYISFNDFSRSQEHKMAVAMLRDNKLHSWESEVVALIANADKKTLPFIAKRPGMMLRMFTVLLRNGFSVAKIEKELTAHAEDLSPQTLVTLMNFFGNSMKSEKFEYYERFLPNKAVSLPNTVEAEQIFPVLKKLLQKRLTGIDTPIKGKKVFLSFDKYDLDMSTLQCNNKSAEGGYIRSGIAYRIPNDVKNMRFFVYWNDKDRVDLDLHCFALTKSGETIQVGWFSNYIDQDVIFSGDLTCSNSAEYIDVVMDSTPKFVSMKIHLFDGKSGFNEIEDCFVGLMGVSSICVNVKLYNPQNCFFSHRLTSKKRFIDYGYINTEKRVLIFDGKASDTSDWSLPNTNVVNNFTLTDYLNALFAAQDVQVVQNADEADYVLIMDKPTSDKEISLIDQNFFI